MTLTISDLADTIRRGMKFECCNDRAERDKSPAVFGQAWRCVTCGNIFRVTEDALEDVGHESTVRADNFLESLKGG